VSVKSEEVTEFQIDWGDGQHINLEGSLANAATLLSAGPLPFQIGTRSTSYMALGDNVPERWLGLFDKAVDETPFEAELTYTTRAELGYITQTVTLSPCEHGEHLHASVTLTYTIAVTDTDTPESLRQALYEAWRVVGEKMAELQEVWVHPYLEQALELENLHGGR
jgi:hypothetical protein